MSKPRVLTRCVANHYTSGNERIVEVASEGGGCLISFREIDGRLLINVYQADRSIDLAPISYSREA